MIELQRKTSLVFFPTESNFERNNYTLFIMYVISVPCILFENEKEQLAALFAPDGQTKQLWLIVSCFKLSAFGVAITKTCYFIWHSYYISRLHFTPLSGRANHLLNLCPWDPGKVSKITKMLLWISPLFPGGLRVGVTID